MYFPTHETDTSSASGTLLSIETFRRPLRQTSETICERHRFHQPRVAAGRTVYMQVTGAPYLFALRVLAGTAEQS